MESRGLNLCPERQIIFWLPHRCGARYVFEVLQRAIGLRGGEGGGLTHAFKPPPPGHRVALLVRNPYARLLSVWAWLQEIRQLDPHVSFREFVFSRGNRAMQPISLQVAGAVQTPEFQPDILLRLEHLGHDLVAAFPGVEFVLPPNRYQSRILAGRPWPKWYDEEMAAAVRQAYHRDFELGGYSAEVA